MNFNGWKKKGNLEIKDDTLHINQSPESVSIRKSDLRILRTNDYKLERGNPTIIAVKLWWILGSLIILWFSIDYYDQGTYSIGGYIEGNQSYEFFENDLPMIYNPFVVGVLLAIVLGLLTIAHRIFAPKIKSIELIGNGGRLLAHLHIVQNDNEAVANLIKHLKKFTYA